MTKKIKPNFRTLGRKVGMKMQKLQIEISLLSEEDIAKIEAEGFLEMPFDGQPFRLELEDVIIKE